MSDRDVRLKSVCICFLQKSVQFSSVQSSVLSVVAPRIELGTTQLSAASGRPALDYQIFRFLFTMPRANCAPVSQVVREALESSPTGLQPIALPLELPNQVCFWVAVDA